MICTSDIMADEFNGLDLPSHAQFMWVRAQGVSHDALTSPTWPRAARVEFNGGTFVFSRRHESEGECALVFLADDDFGHIDLVAWNPRTGNVATWLGRAWALGQDKACTPWRIDQDGALPVFRTALSWLQAGREGVVILDFRKAADAIVGPVLAEDAVHKRELDRALAQLPARVIVRAEARRATA